MKNCKKLIVKKTQIISEVVEEEKREEIIPHLRRPSSTSEVLLRLSNTECGKKPKPLGDIINA